MASGPLTATFMLPFAMGACEALGGNVMTDAFGLVALVVVVIGDDATVHIDAEATGEIVEAARVFGGHDIGPFQEGHQTG